MERPCASRAFCNCCGSGSPSRMRALTPMFPDAGSDVVAADDSTPGNAGDLRHQSGEKSPRIFLFELGWRQTNAEGQSARWINSYRGRLKFQKTPKHQSRAY